MKYKVFIRGQKEPLITEDSFIQEEFNNYMQFKKNKVIQIGNWNGKVSDIKYIQEEKDENEWREKYEQYNRERRERAKRSPEEKAESSVNGQYKLYSWCVGVDFELTKDRAKELALRFFKENTERNLADLNIWFEATGLESKDIKMNRLQEAGLAILARSINSEIVEIAKDLQAFGGGFSYPQ
jgi:hypothetical protein